MTQEARITFGSDGVPTKTLNQVKGMASDIFGGFTVINANGGWLNENDTLVEEDSKVLVVRGDDSDLTGNRLVEDWAKASAMYMQRHSNEDAIMWDVRELKSSGMET